MSHGHGFEVRLHPGHVFVVTTRGELRIAKAAECILPTEFQYFPNKATPLRVFGKEVIVVPQGSVTSAEDDADESTDDAADEPTEDVLGDLRKRIGWIEQAYEHQLTAIVRLENAVKKLQCSESCAALVICFVAVLLFFALLLAGANKVDIRTLVETIADHARTVKALRAL